MNPNVSTNIVLEKRTPKKDGTYPVKLRVTYFRKQKYYATGYSINEDDFLKVTGTKPRGELKELKLELNRFEQNAVTIIGDLENFTFSDFEIRFLKKGYRKNSLSTLFTNYIDLLKNQNRLKSAISYQCALKSLMLFSGKNDIPLSKIDSAFLSQYERWMLEKNNTKTTIGFYLRCLRAILNTAISKGLFDLEKYPFGKNRYKIPTGANIKKSLTKADIKKLKNYKVKPTNLSLSRSLDYWLFSYYCNGINIKDIARLRFRNIEKDTITILRAKTENSGKSSKPILISLLPEAKRIIEKWGNPPLPPNYVFPILRNGMSTEEEIKIIAQVVQNINKGMKKIAKELKIDVPVTTYVARHTYATMLKRGGVPIEYISESLGHTNVLTTENYLASFDDETREKFSRILVDL